MCIKVYAPQAALVVSLIFPAHTGTQRRSGSAVADSDSLTGSAPLRIIRDEGAGVDKNTTQPHHIKGQLHKSRTPVHDLFCSLQG